MKKLLFCFLLTLIVILPTQAENHIKPSQSIQLIDSTVEVFHSASLIILKTSNINVVIEPLKQAKFLSIIDSLIKALDEISSIGLYNGKIYYFYTYHVNVSIRFSLVLKQEGYTSMYIYNNASYTIINLTKQNLIDLKKTIEEYMQFIKSTEDKSKKIETLIFNLSTSLGSGE